MSRGAKQLSAALASGLLFGVGLVASGMTNPGKIIAFLDLGGAWDPSLACVMLGAIAVHYFAYRWVRGSAAPLFADEFTIPGLRHIDARLIGGAALFGVGWGLGGYCPGPGIVSLGAGRVDAAVFVLTLMLGWLLAAKYDDWRAAARASRSVAPAGARARPSSS
jgi:uncharacterized membrane protein YedE/YeeE